jgi:hypothetical protein
MMLENMIRMNRFWVATSVMNELNLLSPYKVIVIEVGSLQRRPEPAVHRDVRHAELVGSAAAAHPQDLLRPRGSWLPQGNRRRAAPVGHEPAAGPFISDEHILRFSRA